MLEVMLRRKNQIYIPEDFIMKDQIIDEIDASVVKDMYAQWL